MNSRLRETLFLYSKLGSIALGNRKSAVVLEAARARPFHRALPGHVLKDLDQSL